MQNITRGLSDTKPPKYYDSAGLIQVLVNTKQIEIIDHIDSKISRLCWQYDYVDIIRTEVTKIKIETALIKYNITTLDIITDIIITEVRYNDKIHMQ